MGAQAKGGKGEGRGGKAAAATRRAAGAHLGRVKRQRRRGRDSYEAAVATLLLTHVSTAAATAAVDVAAAGSAGRRNRLCLCHGGFGASRSQRAAACGGDAIRGGLCWGAGEWEGREMAERGVCVWGGEPLEAVVPVVIPPLLPARLPFTLAYACTAAACWLAGRPGSCEEAAGGAARQGGRARGHHRLGTSLPSLPSSSFSAVLNACPLPQCVGWSLNPLHSLPLPAPWYL